MMNQYAVKCKDCKGTHLVSCMCKLTSKQMIDKDSENNFEEQYLLCPSCRGEGFLLDISSLKNDLSNKKYWKCKLNC